MWSLKFVHVDKSTTTYDENSIIDAGIEFEDSIGSSTTFALGACVTKECSLKIADKLAQVNKYYHAEVEVLENHVSYGKYICYKAEKKDGILSLKCYDHMIYAKRNIDTLIAGNTYGALAFSACDGCGLELLTQTFDGAERTCKVPDTENMTYCDLLAYIAQATCNYVKVNTEGKVCFEWYDIALSESISGGIFDDAVPTYKSGANIDGGDFSYTNGDNADGGTFIEVARTHTIMNAFSLDIGTDDIYITGIKVKNDNVEYIAGTEGYLLSVEDNPLTSGMESACANYIASKCVGMSFRTFTASIPENIDIHTGDSIYITDAFNEAYKSYITSVKYTVHGNTEIRCEAATPVMQEMNHQSVATKILTRAEQSISRKINTYDKTAQNMTSLISQGFGLFTTTETDEYGAVKQYLHDKESLEDSTVIWTRTAQGLMVSKDGRTSWAVDSNGNALFNVITAKGINADWVKVGGQGNGDGQIVVKNAAGATIILLNNSGITMADGTSLINASGVCGDLTFSSGGVPYDLGFAGNVFAGNFAKQEIYLQALIPSNYVITSAILMLSTCATVWNSVLDGSGETVINNKCNGYPRGIKAYIGTGQVYKSATWDSEYTYGATSQMSQIISGNFVAAGVDGSPTTSPKQLTTGNIKALLKTGLNTIKITVEDFTGDTNFAYAQRTGTASALLSVKGYTKN